MDTPELRRSARLIWEAALIAANPATCIRKFVQFKHGLLAVNGQPIALHGHLIVVGTGKASARMAQVVEDILDERIHAGLVVTKYDHSLPLKRIQLVEAGHPIPDAAGVTAVERTRDLLRDLTEDDIVLCLISGGGSALWPAPAEGITLEQKQEVTQLLLRAGATIRELNAVRKHLSAIKGGQLARWASPARVISLIMSDVIGDPLDFIASGPTAPDTTSFPDALAIIQKYGVKIPQAVLQRLQDGAEGRIADTPKPGDPLFVRVQNHIIANNRLLVDAAIEKARELDFNTSILSTEIEGEAREAGRFFSAIAREIGRSGNPVRPPACVLAAGETTVTVHGRGLGGRNQEMALSWAIDTTARPPERPSCFASVATDGSDGPTSAAGGLVDPSTCDRAVEIGLMPSQFLATNDSFNFLKATGDLITTGPTQTNLMDLQILLVG
jgi:hydroxypyruvate reductase